MGLTARGLIPQNAVNAALDIWHFTSALACPVSGRDERGQTHGSRTINEWLMDSKAENLRNAGGKWDTGILTYFGDGSGH
jgi:hypothetical protein